MAARAQIGIIGGSGLGQSLLAAVEGHRLEVDTPFGPPSDAPILARWNGVDIVFLARHGSGHRHNPTAVPYRANIFAMKQLGVSAIFASGATGSLREDIEPGHLVICDQIIDRTFRRANSFFDEAPVVHVELADPFCPFLRRMLAASGEGIGTVVHHAGTYICIEGPQFSTRAESHLHRQWGGDVVGMTCMPEARLAREAEICYALIALPTDYDCWRVPDPSRVEDELMKQILANLGRATQHAVSLLGNVVRTWDTDRLACGCTRALDLAVWSDEASLASQAAVHLRPLLARRLRDRID